MYGGSCACCGESRLAFLAIDHPNNDGAAHRKSGVDKIGNWLFKHNYPKGFRVLCHNCNCARGFYGFCPHEIATHELPFAVKSESFDEATQSSNIGPVV